MRLFLKRSSRFFFAGCLFGACSNSDFSGRQTSGKQSEDAQPDPSVSPTPNIVQQTPTPSVVPVVSPEPPIHEKLMTEEGELCGLDLPGFGGKVYQLQSGAANLPDFSTMTPVGQITAPSLNVPKRAWTSGFPGVPTLTSYFGIRFYAYFKVETDDAFQFKTISDDGSKLYIDSNLVVNNDGTHAPVEIQSAAVQLKAGIHKITVEWFQGPPKHIALQVFWKSSTQSWEIIPVGKLQHGKLCNIPEIGVFN